MFIIFSQLYQLIAVFPFLLIVFLRNRQGTIFTNWSSLFPIFLSIYPLFVMKTGKALKIPQNIVVFSWKNCCKVIIFCFFILFGRCRLSYCQNFSICCLFYGWFSHLFLIVFIFKNLLFVRPLMGDSLQTQRESLKQTYSWCKPMVRNWLTQISKMPCPLVSKWSFSVPLEWLWRAGGLILSCWSQTLLSCVAGAGLLFSMILLLP